MSCNFASIQAKKRFLRTIEIKNGNCCIYKKIPKIITINNISLNAARCWEDRSELIRFKNSEEVVIVVE